PGQPGRVRPGPQRGDGIIDPDQDHLGPVGAQFEGPAFRVRHSGIIGTNPRRPPRRLAPSAQQPRGRWEAIRVRLATWNVNSVKARLPRLLEWLDEAKPDIVCLQEIKTTSALFPEAEVNELGYEVAAHGDGRWNG